MAGYTIAIQKDSPVYKLYQKLKDDGVKDADLDTGYPETDYVKKTRKTVHQGDHKIEETEVLNYALEHYERYQLAIKETTGYDVPWSLDDLNPATDFDAKVRDKVDHAITAFKQSLTAKGLKEGTSRYNELLAVSLYAFVSTGQPRDTGLLRSILMADNVEQELKKEGLGEVYDYLITKGNGGLALVEMEKACKLEATALEALAKSCPSCTEQSMALYAVFRAAGFKPKFIFAMPNSEFNRKDQYPAGTFHASVSVSFGKKIRIFDHALGASNAGPYYKKNRFIWWYGETATEFLVGYFINLGGTNALNGELGRAPTEFKIAINLMPNYFGAHFSLGRFYVEQGDLDRGIPELKTAIKLNPDYASAHYELGALYIKKGALDQAIVELKIAIKNDPNYASAHFNLGVAYAKKSQLDAAAAEFKTVIRIAPDKAPAYLYLGKTYFDKGTQLEQADKEIDALEMYRQALAEFNRAKELGGQVPQENYELLKKKLESPGATNIDCLLGDEYYTKNELTKALVSYQQAVKMDPKSEPALLGIWNTYKAMGDREMAKKTCEKYKKVSRDMELSCQ